jgi:plastocyanin
VSHVYRPFALAAAGGMLIAGCASASSHEVHSTGGNAATPVASPPASAGDRTPTEASVPAGTTLEVTITGRQVDPRPAAVPVAEGETLTIVITSDVENRVHIHGFEIERHLEPGNPVSITLKGRQPGSYEVETHDPELRLFKIVVE